MGAAKPGSDVPGRIIKSHFPRPDSGWRHISAIADKVVERIAAKRRAEAA